MSSMTASALLVSRAFPPYAPSLGGAVRILKLAEYLRNEGVDVHVLAGKGRRYDDFGYGELLRSISVHYVPDPVLARTGPVMQGSEAQARSGLRALLRPLVTECSVPDTGIFALPRLCRVAKELIATHGIANIVTSGPPHSDHLVGLSAKRRYGARLNWIVDYRDSWNGTPLFRKRNALLGRVNRALEQAVLRRADHLTYISEPMIDKAAALLGATGSELRTKSTLVMNGYDVNHVPAASAWVPQGSRLRIGYFGALDDRPDSYRNPAAIFQAIAQNDLDVEVELFGQIRLSQQWKDLLGDKLRVGGVLDHYESVRRMGTMDVLLLLHTRNDGADEVLTGKIFEYLLSGRPVLSVGPAQMAANTLLRELGTGHSVRHDDAAALLATLRQLSQLKATGQLQTTMPHGIEKFSRKYQYSRLKSLLSGGARTE